VPSSSALTLGGFLIKKPGRLRAAHFAGEGEGRGMRADLSLSAPDTRLVMEHVLMWKGAR